MHIHRVDKNDGGLYECLASNEAGRDMRYVQVNVEPKRGDIGKSLIIEIIRNILIVYCNFLKIN